MKLSNDRRLMFLKSLFFTLFYMLEKRLLGFDPYRVKMRNLFHVFFTLISKITKYMKCIISVTQHNIFQ